MSLCNLCPRKCNANREVSKGICGVGESFKIARAGLHFGEEPCISGTSGSGTIFFSGCSLKCVFCQNFEISHNSFGQEIDDAHFLEIIKQLEEKNAHNINLVTPTHYFDKLNHIFSTYKPNVPLICNTSGYESVENIEKDLYDVYLFDLKFFSSDKSLKYAFCSDYFEIATKALRKAIEIKGKPVFDENGIVKSGVIVRHMILPQNTNESIKIIESLDDVSDKIIFSLMSQYVPMYKANEHSEINRKITKREYDKVLNKCLDVNFHTVYTQSRKSATNEFIPNFDLSGI